MNPFDSNRNYAELQDFLFVCWLVAGKTAYVQNRKFLKFKKEFNNFGIFDAIYFFGIDYAISMAKKHGLGKYSLLQKFIKEFNELNIDLKQCTAEDLEKLPGVGLKTSRFFLINTRSNYRCAVIDTHIIKFISENIQKIDFKQPPNKKKYLEYETLYLNYCDKNNLNPQEFDIYIWKKYSKKPK